MERSGAGDRARDDEGTRKAADGARGDGARSDGPAGGTVPRALLVRAMARAALRRIERLAEPPLTFALFVPDAILVAPPDILAGEGGQAEDIYGGRFELAGHTVETGGASPFAVLDAPGPWLRALHGFGWLRHAGVRGDALARAHARALAGDWFREHGHPGRGPAWEPLVAATRLRHWLSYSPVLLSPGAGGAPEEDEGAVSAIDPGFDDRFLRQIAVHRRHLRRTARDARDPLVRLQVIASLAIASLALPSGREEQRRLGAALDAELAEQVLHDGGHVSRRAAASVDLLAALMPLGRCYVARGLVAPPGLLPAIDRMVPALRHHLMGDGTLARHNGTHGVRLDRLAAILDLDDRVRDAGEHDVGGHDAGEKDAGEKDGAGEPPDAASTPTSTSAPAPAFGIGSAAGVGASAGAGADGAPLELPESGYQRLAVGGTVVVADTGTLPPPEHASRAHAGPSSFEMSVGGAALVVNLGSAEPGEPNRDELVTALRFAEAHSTLAPVGHAPARIATGASVRRLFGEPMVNGPSAVELRRADAGDATWRGLRAVHDGYRAAGIRHERVLMLRDGGTRLNGTDRMLPLAPALVPPLVAPALVPRATVRFHLHPDVLVETDGDGDEDGAAGVALRVGGQAWRFTADVPTTLEETLFCDARPVRSTQIVLRLGGERAAAEWSFHRVDSDDEGSEA